MKTTKLIFLLFILFCISINSYSQANAILKGGKISVHKIDGKYGSFQGNYGYTFDFKGKLNIELTSGEHSIEFTPWYGEPGEYKLVFTAEENKIYEIVKQKGDSERPRLIDSKTKEPINNTLITKVMHIKVDKNDNIIHLYNENNTKSDLSILSLAPEKFDIIPIVYKIDDIWGPVSAGCMWRFNDFKMGGGDLRGAMKYMSFSVELLPGEHTIEYSFHSNKVNFSIKDGLSTGADSYEVYQLKFNFEADKSYTFKYLDEKDPTSLVIIESVE